MINWHEGDSFREVERREELSIAVGLDGDYIFAHCERRYHESGEDATVAGPDYHLETPTGRVLATASLDLAGVWQQQGLLAHGHLRSLEAR